MYTYCMAKGYLVAQAISYKLPIVGVWFTSRGVHMGFAVDKWH